MLAKNIPGSSSIKSELSKTFQLLKEGEAKIQLSERYKNVILVLGITGGGKSTFIQWIAGDNDKLIAKEVTEGSGMYIIEDGNRIGNSTLTSKTVFPELVVAARTDTAYYDCPGFSDTRSTSNDIATTYFIKKVADHAENVKMIFVVSQSSVTIGENRLSFKNLLKHATVLVKDIDKFQNSIAIMVTKVDNQYIKVGRTFSLVPDEKVIEAIGDFLKEVKLDQEQSLGSASISDNEKKNYENNIKFVNTLLIKDGKNYTRIGIFRRPDESGPLSSITLLQEGKEHIDRILNKNIVFTSKDNDDFGYTISDTSKNVINDLVEGINDIVWSNIENIVENMQKHFNNSVEVMCKKIKSFATSTKAVEADRSEAQNFSDGFNEGYNITTSLTEEVRNVPTDRLEEKIRYAISALGINGCEQDILSILNQGKYFAFLQVVSDSVLATRRWDTLLQPIVTYLSYSKQEIQKDINDTTKEIYDQINSNLSSVAENIEEHYRRKMRSMEIQKLPAELNKGYGFILNMTQEIDRLSTAQELSRKIRDTISNLDISDFKIRSNTYSVFNLGKYLEFLQIISNEPLKTWSSNWIGKFFETAEYLNESSKWYIFLNNLHKKLSEYGVQKDKSIYNVANIEDWGQQGKPQGIFVTRHNFRKFLEKVKPFTDIENFGLENLQDTEMRVEELRQVFSLTLHNRINVLCQSDKLVIKGDYIKLSDVNIERRNCSKTSIEIFALNKIFIEQDFNKVGDNIKLVMIAPRWEVIGSKKIDLSGSNGQSHDLPKANNGIHPGNSGDHGKPGLPGGSAGSFFGIGAEFFNGNVLKIIANGGKGGPGQNGGNGASGSDGNSPSRDPKYYHDKYGCISNCDGLISGFKYKCNVPSYYSQCTMAGCIGYKFVTLVIDGQKGTNSGNGGNGGQKGIGGKSGDIRIITLGDDSGISAFSDDGKPGIAGEGGDAGEAVGKHGVSIKMELGCKYSQFGSFPEWSNKSQTDNGWASSGNNGVNGANGENIKSPDSAAVISNKAEIINDYKSYLRENLIVAGSLFRNNYLMFYDQLNRNSNVKNVYDTQGFFDELQGLEKQFHKLNTEDLVYFYQSLLDRISEYAQNPKDDEKSNQHKKTLAYLYTAALSKLYDLKNDPDSTMIIDVGAYLNLVEGTINTLANIRKKSNKVTIINKYKEDYKTNIDKKIEESNGFIEEQITPAIDQIKTQIDNKIDLLIDENIELQKEAEKNRDALLEKKKKSQNALALRRLFSVFKILGQVITLLGPIGAAAGAVIGGVSSIAESFVLDDQTGQQRPVSLPPGITSNLKLIESQIKAIKDKKITSFNKKLEIISQEIDQHPALKDISESVKNIKAEIEEMRNSGASYLEIKEKKKEFEDKLNEELKAKENELKTQKTVIDKKTAKAIVAITKVNQFVEIGGVGLDIYNKIKNDQAKLDAMSDAIKQEEINLQRLKQYEDKIYSAIAPTIKMMGKDLKEIESKLGTKSEVALDVTKWQVQSQLKDIKLQMRQLTKGFKVEDDLARCIEKLEEAMTTLINIYDRIQDYQEQQNLANYIAAVSASHSADSLQDNLEILIRSNLILKQYERAVNALKQWVFPFAAHYLERIKLPSHLNLDITNIEDLASEAIEQIGLIKEKLNEYKTAIQDHDQHINYALFGSHHVSTNPFFVWKNEEHNDLISKLLHGEAIVVKADVTGSAPDKDAIKFNLIGTNLRSDNETIQLEINDKLKGFKVSATHLGNSYYRYDYKLYVISSKSQNIQYSFEKDSTGVPVYMNRVYKKIKDGDLMLSPYAMWEIQLINHSKMISFKELIIYKAEVDLELVGKGIYVDKGAHIPGLNIEDYYRSEDTTFAIDNDIYDQYKLQEQEIIPHNVTSFRGRRSLEARNQSNNEDNVTEYVILNSHEILQSGTEHLLMATSENPPQTTDVTLTLPEHNKYRRSVDIPVTSSASKPTSWVGSVIQFGKELVDKATALYNKPEEPASDDHNNLHPSSLNLGDRWLSDPQPGPTLLEMGDQWIKNTDMSGLLTFGTLLARKWTGYRPTVLKAPSYDPSTAIHLDIRSQELVNAFLDKVQEQAQACGIEKTTSDIFESYKLYTQAIKIVSKKLATGQVYGIATSLFEHVVQSNISKIASITTPDQAGQLSASILEDLPNLEQQFLEAEVSLQSECQEEKLANTTSTTDINLSKQEICDIQSIDQLAAATSTLHLVNTYNMENVFVKNNITEDVNQYIKCGSM